MNVVHHPHTIFCNGTPTFTLSQISDVNPGHNFQDITEFAAGQVGPQFTGTHQASPDNRFSTTQLYTLLAAVTGGSYNVARDLSAATVDMEFRRGLNLGTRYDETSASHLRMRMLLDSMLCFESLSARQGGLAQARCRHVAVYNYTTGVDPLVATSGVAISASGGINTLYTLGPAVLNGTILEGIQEGSLDNNLSYDEQAADGDGFLTFAGIDTIAPVLTFQSRNLYYLDLFGSRGTALSSLTWYLRKKLASGINVPLATAEHIAITATTGTIKAREISGGGKPTCRITVDLTMSAVNTAPYAVSTTSAIAGITTP